MKLKIFTLLIIAGILSANVFSQPTITKQKDIGGGYDDIFTCMDLTNDGGLITGGYSVSNISGQKTQDGRGGKDYWIIKVDSLQHIQWDKTIGGRVDDYLKSIQQTSDGGYILGGYSNSDSAKFKNQNSKGGYDYWVIKLDDAGNIQWEKTIGGSLNDYLASVIQTNDGGYIIGGTSYSNISGDKTENSKGHSDYWLVKLNSSGNTEWDKTIGGGGYDGFASIQQTSDNGYILGGTSNSHRSGDKTTPNDFNDYWIVKLDNNANIQWDRTIGGNYYDVLTSLQQTLDGGYILGGYSESGISGNKTENSKGYYDYWVVKLNGLGHVQWDKTVGGNTLDQLNSIQQTRDGGYVLGGYSGSHISGDKTQDNYKNDYWVVKLDNKGIVKWDKTIGGIQDDILQTVKEKQKDQYILGGYSRSRASIDKTRETRGRNTIYYHSNDYWIVYLDDTSPNNSNKIASSNKISLQSTIAANQNFSAYPNPVKDVLYVQSKNKTNFSLTDQSGKTILIKTINGNGEINVVDLTPGIYYLKNNETGVSQKIVVVK